MRITVCDLYSFNETMIIDGEITCGQLKIQIASQFGRDMSNCTIYYNQEPLKDSKAIKLSSTFPYIIIDDSIEKFKHNIDTSNPYHPSSRFQKDQCYNNCKNNLLQCALLLPISQLNDSSDDDEEEQPFLSTGNDNDIDANNDNLDDNDETDLYVHNDSDSENDSYGHNDSDSDNSSSENEENGLDAENNPPFFLISNSSNNTPEIHIREDQPPTRRRLESDIAFFNPYPAVNLYAQNQNAPTQNQQRRPVHQQAGSQTETRATDLINLQDSIDAVYEDSIENEDDDNGNSNENNGNLQIELTQEERDIIRQICRDNERFDEYTIIQVFEACGRDAQTTIQCLSTM